MENNILIINNRKNDLEFDVTVQGVNTTDTDVRFVIKDSELMFSFECVNISNDTWLVSIPPMDKFLSLPEYPFHVEVIIDGYFFTPFAGTLEVKAEPEVSASDMHKQNPIAPTVTVKNKSVEEDNEYKVHEESNDQDTDDDLADLLIASKQKQTVKESSIDVPKIDIKKKIKKIPRKKKQTKKKVNILKDKDLDKIVEDAVQHTNNDEKSSTLSEVIHKLSEEPELSEQAQKVRNILKN